VFNRRSNRHGVYRFLHTTTGNDRNHGSTGSGQGHADAIAEAPQSRKENSAQDGGYN